MSRIKNLLSLTLAASCVLLSGLTASPVSASGESELTWNTKLSVALKQAKDQRKFVLADVYTDWCGWCKRLDADTYSDPKFVQFATDNFVCTKLNAEDKGEGERTAQENGVSGFPTALIMNSDGKVIGKVIGYKKANAMEAELEKIIKHAK